MSAEEYKEYLAGQGFRPRIADLLADAGAQCALDVMFDDWDAWEGNWSTYNRITNYRVKAYRLFYILRIKQSCSQHFS